LFKKGQDPKYALLARDTYLKNFTSTKNYYPGINSATMSVMAGQASKGREIAQEVIKNIDPDTNEFWEIVTLAEAYLLSKNSAKAIELYIKARKMINTDWGKISSVSNQLWLLNHYLAVPGAVTKAYHPPGVAAFVGHMIDQPGRPYPRFPYYIEKNIKDALHAAIRTLNIKIGYTSIACGSDILFCEALMEADGEINIILCFDKDEFLETSIRYAGEEWERRFQQLIERYPVTYLTHEKYEGTDELFSLQSRMILGSALHRGSLLQTKAHLLSVLSETDMTRKAGGTRDTIALWPHPQQQWTNINPDRFIDESRTSTSSTHTAKQFIKTPNREVRYMVLIQHSPIQGIEDFVRTFVDDMPESIGIVWNTYEDAMLIAFKVLRDSGEFAFKFLAHAQSKKIAEETRVVIHIGPVVIKGDEANPVQGDQLDIIQDVAKVALKGNVYATTSFAMTASLPPGIYNFEYAGRVDIAKFSIKQDLFKVTK